MTQQLVAVAFPGYNAETDTNPNHYAFHSAYNTFKIIGTGTVDFTIAGSATDAPYSLNHNLEQIPLVLAFMVEDGSNLAITPNNGIVTNLAFESVRANYTQIIFHVTNQSASPVLAHFRYYMFEVPL